MEYQVGSDPLPMLLFPTRVAPGTLGACRVYLRYRKYRRSIHYLLLGCTPKASSPLQVRQASGPEG